MNWCRWGQCGQARQRRLVEIEQREADRHHHVFDRTVGVDEEGRGDDLRSGLHMQRRCLDLVVLGGGRIDAEQRDALAIDRDLDLLRLALRRAEQLPADVVIEGDAEGVLAIGGKIVHHRHAAAGAQRRAVDMPDLRDHARQLVGGHLRRGAGLAQCLAADLAGGAHVGIHQRGRQAQHFGHVVEAVAEIIAGQQLVRIDFHAQQVAHRVGVLGAIHPMQRRVAEIRMRGGPGVDAAGEAREEAVQRRIVGTLLARRRHHLHASTANHLFGQLDAGFRGDRNRHR